MGRIARLATSLMQDIVNESVNPPVDAPSECPQCLELQEKLEAVCWGEALDSEGVRAAVFAYGQRCKRCDAGRGECDCGKIG